MSYKNQEIDLHWFLFKMLQNIGKHRNQEELYKYRSSHSRCSISKAVLKDFLLFSRKHLCMSLFLIKRLQHKCFPVNIANFFLQNTFAGCFWQVQNEWKYKEKDVYWVHSTRLSKVRNKYTNYKHNQRSLSCNMQSKWCFEFCLDILFFRYYFQSLYITLH